MWAYYSCITWQKNLVAYYGVKTLTWKMEDFNLLISSPNRTLAFTTLTTRENLYMDTEMYLEEILGFD